MDSTPHSAPHIRDTYARVWPELLRSRLHVSQRQVPSVRGGFDRVVVMESAPRPGGETLLFVHGLLCSVFSWRRVLPRLAESHRVIAFDLPGFGYSERNPARGLTDTDHVERIRHLLNLLGEQHAVLVGHSMGGGIAQRFAALYPSRVRALVLIGSTDVSESIVRGVTLPGMRSGFTALLGASPVIEWVVARGLRSAVGDPNIVDRDFVDGFIAPLRVPGTVECLLTRSRQLRYERTQDLSRIDSHTLVITGELDKVCRPAIGRRIAARIRRAQQVVMPAIGHMPMEEAPERVCDLINHLISHTYAEAS